MKDHSFASLTFEGRRIIVLGDVMLDRFVYGNVARISPEAPIPVLLIDKESAMPGGAANVARNVAALGGEAILIGVIGDDRAGDSLQAMLDFEKNLAGDFVRVPTAQTTEKIRFIAAQQQLLRADSEQPQTADWQPLAERFFHHLPGAHAIVLSDYAKGVLSPELLKPVIAAARDAGIPIVLDPKNLDCSRYNGVTVLTPNRGEAAAMSGIAIEGDEDAAAAAKILLDMMPETQSVLITRGADGMTLARRDGSIAHSPALAREVFDVSGAGDTVTASLALSLATGLSLDDAVLIANTAGGLVVGKHNTAVVSHDELLKALLLAGQPDFTAKVVGLEECASIVAGWRKRGVRIGFTNGCFDLIHPGHVSLLTEAKGVCDRLVVGLNTDSSIKRLKGPTRPVQDEVARAIVLGSLSAVDMIVLFDENTPIELICAIRPDVLVKGQDYTVDQVVGAAEVTAYGGRVHLATIQPGQSTSRTIARIAEKVS